MLCSKNHSVIQAPGRYRIPANEEIQNLKAKGTLGPEQHSQVNFSKQSPSVS